jgi:ActR/RegA family two-component response regulator
VLWIDVLDTLARELGPTGAAAADRAIRAQFAGLRISVPSIPHVDPEVAAQAVVEAPSVDAAARRLGVHRSTVYRLLRQRRGQCAR